MANFTNVGFDAFSLIDAVIIKTRKDAFKAFLYGTWQGISRACSNPFMYDKAPKLTESLSFDYSLLHWWDLLPNLSARH